MIAAPKLSTGIKWVFASLLIEGLMLTLLIMSNLQQLHQTLAAQTQTRLTEISVLLESAISAPLVQMDYATIQAILTETQSLHGINYMIVMDNKGQRVSSVDWDSNTPIPIPEADAFSDTALADGRFDTRIDIKMHGIPLGSLQLGLSTEFYRQASHNALKRSSIIAGLELILSAILLFTLNAWFSKRFSLLSQQANAIAEGKYHHRLDASEHPDYDQLVQAFNHMASTIGEKIHDLEKAHANEKQMNTQIIKLVNQDYLTGIPNRYAIESQIHQYLNTSTPFCMAIIDIDRLKPINEKHGHHIGDEVLIQFAQSLQSYSAQHHIKVGRYAGDEFIALIPHHQEAARQVHQLFMQLSGISIETSVATHHLTFSLGYTCYPTHADDLQALIQQSESALLQTKLSGGHGLRAYHDGDGLLNNEKKQK